MPQSLQTTHDGRERRECVPIKKAEKNYKRTLTACYLQAGLLGGMIFPVALTCSVLLLRRGRK